MPYNDIAHASIEACKLQVTSMAAIYYLEYAVLLHRGLVLAMHGEVLHVRRCHQPADIMHHSRSAGSCRRRVTYKPICMGCCHAWSGMCRYLREVSVLHSLMRE